MKFETSPKLESRLGLDPADPKKNDQAFYDWIAGSDPDKPVGGMLTWLIDAFKEEEDESSIRAILEDWRASCDADEFKSRLSVLGKLMPERHPFHKIKREFQNGSK